MLSDVEVWLPCCMIYDASSHPINTSQNFWENQRFHQCIRSLHFLRGSKCTELLCWQRLVRRAQVRVRYTKWGKCGPCPQGTHDLVALVRRWTHNIGTGKALVRTQVKYKVKAAQSRARHCDTVIVILLILYHKHHLTTDFYCPIC